MAINCNCPECQFGRESEQWERNAFYNVLWVKAKDWGKVKFKWDTKYHNICIKKLCAIADTFNQKHYQWLIKDRLGMLVMKSDNTTPAELTSKP